ncbi:MAG: metallophosphoesterase, partial [Desulfobulbaceae bacterium]|nr:metallophosphoesterase [Desulfobulbaceae bacterium]
MAGKKKTLFVSDIHLGAGKKWDWFDPEIEGPKLIKFFEYVTARQSKRKDIKEIVLLGDVFDLWVCPHDKEPHTFDQIIDTHADIIGVIKKMSDTVRTIYVNGNHDYQVTEEDINRAFDGKVMHIGNRYQRGNILAIHGHEYALFNRPDPKNGGPRLRLPLGYYITRLHTTLGKKRGAKAGLIFQIIDESFQVMGPEKLPESVLDALKDTVEMITDENTGEKYNVKDFTMGHICADQEFGVVRDRYGNLYDDWKKSVGFWKSTQMIMCELNHLG